MVYSLWLRESLKFEIWDLKFGIWNFKFERYKIDGRVDNKYNLNINHKITKKTIL